MWDIRFFPDGSIQTHQSVPTLNQCSRRVFGLSAGFATTFANRLSCAPTSPSTTSCATLRKCAFSLGSCRGCTGSRVVPVVHLHHQLGRVH